MQNQRVVMRDIAIRAGVHQTTVSLALKNDPRLARETRERIQKLAQEMGYVRDPHLSSLVSYRRSSRTMRQRATIALVFDVRDPHLFEESEYLPTVKSSILARAAELGYRVDTFTQGIDFNSSEMLDRVLKTRDIRGILFGAIYEETTSFQLDWDHYSLIKINQSPLHLEIDSVMGNYALSARIAMRKLKEAGYRRPAMAGSARDEYNTRNQFAAGFLYGQMKHFHPSQHIPFFHFEPKPNKELNEEVFQWLKSVRPDALLSYWNNLAEPALRLTLEEKHPCRFVSVDGDSRTVLLGGIENNYARIGQTAVELLVGKMEMNLRGIPDSPTTTLVHEKWHDFQKWPPYGLTGVLSGETACS